MLPVFNTKYITNGSTSRQSKLFTQRSHDKNKQIKIIKVHYVKKATHVYLETKHPWIILLQ